jgi:hypothetical protein
MKTKILTAHLLRVGQKMVKAGKVLKVLAITEDRKCGGLNIKTRAGWELMRRDQPCITTFGARKVAQSGNGRASIALTCESSARARR